MDAYSLRETYQKEMDAIADRFYKAGGLVTLVSFSFAWAIFSAAKDLMQYPLAVGASTLIGMFILMGLLRDSAHKAELMVQEAFKSDHHSRFGDHPPRPLTGLYP